MFFLLFFNNCSSKQGKNQDAINKTDITDFFEEIISDMIEVNDIGETIDICETKETDWDVEQQNEIDSKPVEIDEATLNEQEEINQTETEDINDPKTVKYDNLQCSAINNPEIKKCKIWNKKWEIKKIGKVHFGHSLIGSLSAAAAFDAAMDSKGNIHIAYMFNYGYKRGKVKVLYLTDKFDKNQLQETVIDDNLNSSNMFEDMFIAITLDESDKVHIMYRRYPGFHPEPYEDVPDLVHVTNETGEWVKEAIPSDIEALPGGIYSGPTDLFGMSIRNNVINVADRLMVTDTFFAKKENGKWKLLQKNENYIKGFDSFSGNKDNGTYELYYFISEAGFSSGTMMTTENGSFKLIINTTTEGPLFIAPDIDGEIKACSIVEKDFYDYSEEFEKVYCPKSTHGYGNHFAFPFLNSDDTISALSIFSCLINKKMQNIPYSDMKYKFYLFKETDKCKFSRIDVTDHFDKLLKKLEQSTTDDIIDPETGEKIDELSYKSVFDPIMDARIATDNCKRNFYSVHIFTPNIYHLPDLQFGVSGLAVTDGTNITVEHLSDIKSFSFHNNIFIDNDQNLHLIYLEDAGVPPKKVPSPDGMGYTYTGPNKDTDLNVIHAIRKCIEYY